MLIVVTILSINSSLNLSMYNNAVELLLSMPLQLLLKIDCIYELLISWGGCCLQYFAIKC